MAWAPLAELDESFARAERARLEEQRLTALEQRIGADLELGRHAQLVPELEGARPRARPLRERRRGQLMLALYRAGRQAEAHRGLPDRPSASRRGARAQPDDELQRLERAILNHDPSLESPVVAGVKRPSRARRRASSRILPAVPPASVAVIDLQRSRVVGHVLVGRDLSPSRSGTARSGSPTQTMERSLDPSGSPRSHQDDRNRSTGDRPRCRHRCGLGGRTGATAQSRASIPAPTPSSRRST